MGLVLCVYVFWFGCVHNSLSVWNWLVLLIDYWCFPFTFTTFNLTTVAVGRRWNKQYTHGHGSHIDAIITKDSTTFENWQRLNLLRLSLFVSTHLHFIAHRIFIRGKELDKMEWICVIKLTEKKERLLSNVKM